MTLELRVYYDFASPFCYVAREITGRLHAEHGVVVDWQPFETIDYLPPRGAMPQNPAFVRRAEAREAEKLAMTYGVELHLRERLLNSGLALAAVELARDVETAERRPGLLDAVHDALFAAYYRDQRDISDPDVVREVTHQVGLIGADEPLLRSDRFTERVARSRASAHDLGVVAVPTFLLAGFGIVGVPAYSQFQALVARGLGADAGGS